MSQLPPRYAAAAGAAAGTARGAPAETGRAEILARELRRDILTGRYRPGERLPSERELAARAGTHRGSAREALKILAQQRLIEIRPGGSRVIPVHRASLDVVAHMLALEDTPDRALVAQLLDVHELLLAGAVRLAVERASEEELRVAGTLVDSLRDPEVREPEYLATLADLLELIAAASRNLVLRMVGHGILAVLAGVVPLLRRARPEHEQLAPALDAVREALDARDAARAEEAIRAFLRVKRATILSELGTGAA